MNKKKKALVIGSSMAGLLAARVCADHFDQVVVIEKDKLSPNPEHRKGVPQSHQVHVLLSKVYEALVQRFPGIMERLQEQGAIRGDLGLMMKWYKEGGYRPQCETGLQTVLLSRPLLESTVRQMLLALECVTLVDGTKVTGLLHEGNTVTGVQTEEQSYSADLVIDTRGFGSRLLSDLKSMGYDTPAAEKVKVNVTYSTYLFPRPNDFRTLINISSNPPYSSKQGTVQPIEDGKMLVMVQGRANDTAPKDLKGFQEYAQALDSSLLYQHIKDIEPTSSLISYRVPYVSWLHYERLSDFPEGVLPLGDAICRLNPVYGQGMSSAAIQANVLDNLLRKKGTKAIWKPYFRKVAKELKTPWELTVAEDFKFSGTEGTPPKTLPLLEKYFAKLSRAMNQDPVIYESFGRVVNMISPPTILLYPNIVWRVLRAK